MMRYLLICVILTSLPYWLVATANQQDDSSAASHTRSVIVVAGANTDSAQPNSDQQKQPDKDTRELSAFFIVGIGINILMALAFAWWFSSEWRKSRKGKSVDHDE